MKTKAKNWDVVVIGGGPAGMMSAIRASERGARVLLVEKNDTLGKKLLITGGGRCNLTNAEFDNRKLLSKFKDSEKFLFSAFSQYSVKDTLDFFNSNNLETKVEPGQRVFPITDKALSVWEVLVKNLEKHKVTILSNSTVSKIITNEKMVTGVALKDGEEISAKSVILATGGKSHPETGSTGDGFKWLEEIGHKIVEPNASLVPIETEEAWTKELSGLSFENLKITTYLDGIKQTSKKGKVLLTHFGLSGPAILNMSRSISELLKSGAGEVVLSLDFLPNLDYGQLNTKLQEIFDNNKNKKLKNVLGVLIPSSLIPHILNILTMDGEKFCHSVTRDERILLMKNLKEVKLKVTRLLGEDKAIVTSGGVSLDEVDFKTMSSKLYPNLYLVGDILDIDRPSGGFSLQLCWTTGYVAGNSVSI